MDKVLNLLLTSFIFKYLLVLALISTNFGHALELEYSKNLKCDTLLNNNCANNSLLYKFTIAVLLNIMLAISFEFD